MFGDFCAQEKHLPSVSSFSGRNRQSVLHGDINCGNFCLDRHLNIKLSDFVGSSINGSPAMVCYSASHQLPENRPSTSNGIMISEKTQIFAFSSTLYEMVTGDKPYSGKDDSEIEDLYRHNIFSDVTGLGPLGPVIIRCWISDFGMEVCVIG